jgi:hypothetical protein
MTTARFEQFLASLYVDGDLRARFAADARATAAAAGFDANEIEALARIDRIGLELASRSFAAKRARLTPPGRFAALFDALRLSRRRR